MELSTKMPIYVFTCKEGHSKEVWRTRSYKRRVTRKCEICKSVMYRDVVKERCTVTASGVGVKGSPSGTYWPNKGIAQGRWIHNVAPNPVYVENKKQYRELLRKTNSVEAG